MPGRRTNLTDADFITVFEEIGPHAMAARFGINVRSIYARRSALEQKAERQITPPDRLRATRSGIAHPNWLQVAVPDGYAIIGSDGHYWPGEVSVAHRGFVHFVKKLKPTVVIVNGDAFDGASISRHPPIGWDHQPTVQEEIESCQDRLDELVKAAPRHCRRIWSLGNHDARFETRIATVAPQFAQVYGTSLKDHFPLWEPCWATLINDDVVVKHRFKGGIHAAHNNTIWAGKTMVTGHLHCAKVTPFTDYNGTRYGVDTGCLANVYGDQFGYAEDNPRNWRSGFAILTFRGGKLLQPELVLAWDEAHVQFRGELVEV